MTFRSEDEFEVLTVRNKTSLQLGRSDMVSVTNIVPVMSLFRVLFRAESRFNINKIHKPYILKYKDFNNFLCSLAKEDGSSAGCSGLWGQTVFEVSSLEAYD